MVFWQTIAFWQGVGSGIVFSISLWLCLFMTYQEGKKATTKEPEGKE